MVSKSCLKLYDYQNRWCNAEGIYAFFILQSIFPNPKGMFFIVSSSTKRVGCLPWERMYKCAHLNHWPLSKLKCKQLRSGCKSSPYTKKLHDPLFKTLLPALTSTTQLQHSYSQSNTYIQPTLKCHLLDICHSH